MEAAVEAPISSRGVLLVEDNALLARVWGRVLAQSGYRVELAGTCAEAARVMETWGERSLAYALVDDRLPDGYGADLLPRMAALRHPPVVALVSGCATTERWIAATKSKASIVPKPETEEGLLELLAYMESGARSASLASAAENEAGLGLALTERGLIGPTGRFPIRRAGLRVLDYLLTREGEVVSASKLGTDLFERNDLRGLELVRKHIADLRAALGTHRDVLETRIGLGYRLQPGHLRRG